MSAFEIDGPVVLDPQHVEPVLRSLPQWFGSERAIQHCLRQVAMLPGFTARLDGTVAGFLTLRRHGATAAEIVTMAVRPEYHRQGIGRALVERAEAWCAASGVGYLQIKTVGPSRPNAAYAKTRAFLAAVSYSPLEEFPTFWGRGNPCVMMIKHVGQHAKTFVGEKME